MVGHTSHTRRDVLKLSGAALATAAGAGVVSANHEHPDVTTVRHEAISSSSVLLTGDLEDMGGTSSVDVWFRWGLDGSGFPNTTPRRTVTSPGSFSDGLSGLAPNTTYEYQAVAQDADGDFGGGAQLHFTTPDDGFIPP